MMLETNVGSAPPVATISTASGIAAAAAGTTIDTVPAVLTAAWLLTGVAVPAMNARAANGLAGGWLSASKRTPTMARSVFATATESGIVGSSVAGSVTGNVRGGVVASLGGSGAMVTVAFRPRSVLGTP